MGDKENLWLKTVFGGFSMKRMKQSFVTPIITKIAEKLKIQIHIEPEFGYVGQITLPNGSKRYFKFVIQKIWMFRLALYKFYLLGLFISVA